MKRRSAHETAGSDATEATLVAFFKGAGSSLGSEGDDHRRTPVEQAIESMRELLKFRRELALSRERGKMRLAVADTCGNGHQYYREAHTAPQCPFCLQSQVGLLRSRIERAREHSAYLQAALAGRGE